VDVDVDVDVDVAENLQLIFAALDFRKEPT
jgi:hypothetical protein